MDDSGRGAGGASVDAPGKPVHAISRERRILGARETTDIGRAPAQVNKKSD
jgi:hypothetical protein